MTLHSLASQGTCSGAPTTPSSYTFPFTGFLALVTSACCSGGTGKIQAPLTSPRPTFLQDRDQDIAGRG